MPAAGQARAARAAQGVRGAPTNDRSAWCALTRDGKRVPAADYTYDAHPLGNVRTARDSESPQSELHRRARLARAGDLRFIRTR